ncbi:Ig-like domain-containing protein [Aliiroseovarius sp. KMU-50]|uniref:Ig-like domain-containing protein n=1 Tax=Aliiroseovarius salicola TaxID=3009082 RepID=A0ABT4W2A0_9RHOB|nr:Ig-like domain-containing protein [Aliiroseovarius sp. KMU-50]MDA5094651.1 Ig-like domain-containing protein [Aliiroseovarius sp. KMU-50]
MSDLIISLYDTTTDELLSPLEDGAILSSSTLTDTTTIVVEIDPDGSLIGRKRSLVMTLTDGTTTYTRRDNNVPYTQFGDSGDDLLNGIELDPGEYEFVVEVYSKPGKKGELLGTYTYTFTVEEAANTPPVANDDGYAVDEDTPLAVAAISGVLANDTDADGNPLTATLLSDVSNGTLTLNPDGSFNYTPDANFNGNDSFTYTLSDGNGGTNTATVTLTVNPVNDDPVAVNDSGYNTPFETPLQITEATLLANDTDTENDPLSITAVGNASGGTVVLVSGVITFTPTAGYSGPASFTYDISDGNGGTATATVSLTVGNNTPPVANDDGYAVDEDTPLAVAAISGVLANDTDADGNPLTATLLSDVSNGTLILNGDGSFNYTPDANFYGNDSFTYTLSDGNGGSSTATVTLTVNPVNDDPVAVDDSGFTTPFETPIDITEATLLANDTDTENDPLSITAVGNASGGTVVLVSGVITFTPTAGYSGPASFTYDIADGNGGTATATVSLTVGNNTPPVANDDGYAVDEDTPLAVAAISGVLANDTDADGNPLTATLLSDVSNGTLILNGDGSFNYTPDANFYGNDSFTYTLSDGNGGSSTATVTLAVSPVNDDPVATDDSATTGENTAVVIDVLANDSDVEDGAPDATSVEIENADDASGKLKTVVGEGIWSVDSVTGEITFTPETGYTGPVTPISYTVADSDGLRSAPANVSVSITPTSEPKVVSISFRLGANGYDGVLDTGIREKYPDQTYENAFTLRVDSGSGNDVQALLWFANLFGSGPGQIPLDAVISSATLTFEVSNSSNNGGTVHRMLTDWDGSSNWDTMDNGIQTDNIEAVSTADYTFGSVELGTLNVDVTASLLAWAAAGATSEEQNAANLGWLFTTPSTNAWDFESSENVNGPLLVISYTLDGSAPPSSTPNVSISEGVPNPQTEGSTATVSFMITLDQAGTDTVTVNYSTVDGTAKAGSDFIGVTNGTITFLPGETSKTIVIALLDDSVVESPEVFTVQINSATNALIDTASAISDILDDDGSYLPPPTLQPSVVDIIDLTSSAFASVDETGYGSGDPSGLAYVPSLQTLFIADSEHNEGPYYSDTNMFSIGPGGLVQGHSLKDFSKEPTGLGYNSGNGFLYVSDDDKQEIYWVDPSNPSVKLGSFDTASAGLTDTEDLVYDPATGHLFVLDGAIKKILEFTDTGEVVNFISLPSIMLDGEALAYDSTHDVFYVASGRVPTIWQIDRSGDILATIDLLDDDIYLNPISGVSPTIKGLELAPSSDPNDGDKLSLYVADYGVDQENDGRLFEIDLGSELLFA